MSTRDGGFSHAQSFHPEFGYLCPSAQFRRKVRIAVITFAAGALITVSVGLALLPQLAPQAPSGGAHEATALTAMAVPPVEKATDLKATNSTDKSMTAATTARAGATERAASAHAQASCDYLSGAFLAPQCRFGKAGKSRRAHAAHEAGARIASVPLGRADAAPQAGAAEAPAREGGPAPEAAGTAAAMNEGPTRPTALDKKPVKIVHRPMQRAPSREAAGANAPATPSRGFDLFAFFH
jgi:hypothetical protein